MDSPRSLKYSTITAQEKLNIVEVAKELGNSKAAKLFHIPLTKLQVGNNQGERKNNCNSGRKAICPQTELVLSNWIRDQREKGLRITVQKVQETIYNHFTSKFDNAAISVTTFQDI